MTFMQDMPNRMMKNSKSSDKILLSWHVGRPLLEKIKFESVTDVSRKIKVTIKVSLYAKNMTAPSINSYRTVISVYA